MLAWWVDNDVLSCVMSNLPNRIGEKFLDWTDEDPSIELILESVSLYWLTGCFSTTIYPYRQVSGLDEARPRVMIVCPPRCKC